MTSENKICKFNCTCTIKNCLYKHSLDIKDRRIYKEVYYNIYDSSKHKEPYNKLPYCNDGLLCDNDKCIYRHICNYDTRIIINRYYKKIKQTEGMYLWELKQDLNQMKDKIK